MSSAKYLAVIAMFACAACVVLAKPSGMELATARHHTVCRTTVVDDTDENRIPRTIKMLKCAEDRYEMCPATNGDSVPCCGALPLAGSTKFSCTEVLDSVLVKYTNTMTERSIKVAVGCLCIKQDPDNAKE